MSKENGADQPEAGEPIDFNNAFYPADRVLNALLAHLLYVTEADAVGVVALKNNRIGPCFTNVKTAEANAALFDLAAQEFRQMMKDEPLIITPDESPP